MCTPGCILTFVICSPDKSPMKYDNMTSVDIVRETKTVVLPA